MTLKLLVSVRDEREAADALSGGADWIDFKEPHAGPLGAVSVSVARRIAQTLNGGCPLSAALGELADWPSSLSRELLAVPEIQVVKLGLKSCTELPDWQTQWRRAFDAVHAAGKQLAAVIYADWQMTHAPSPQEVLECALAAGCRYLLIDTYEKKSVSSVERFSPGELARHMHVAQRGGMTTVLAGNLQVTNFAQLADLPVNVIAVRGAACRENRLARIDPELVRELRTRLNALNSRKKIYQPL
ncbi:MAG: (5-formylfuran-3-yl)methyl phosphate synthase [Bythopirellula sp.]|nr:(5-formylfuran-3-yl)methyl phosphate synthase [Bythopirellula sp.]